MVFEAFEHLSLKAGIYKAIEEVANEKPTETSITFIGEHITYRKLLEEARRLASALSSLGIKKGDRVAIYMYNCPQLIISYMACNAIGAVSVPINPLFVSREVEHVLKDSGSETIICLDILYEKVRQIKHNTNLRNIIITSLSDYLPLYKKVLGALLRKIPKPIKKPSGILFYKGLISKATESLPKVDISPDDVHALLYTSGTTGLPKGAIITNKCIFHYAACYWEFFFKPFMERHPKIKKPIAVVLPSMAHILGKSVALGTLIYGGEVILMHAPNLNEFLRLVSTTQCNFTCGAPTQYIVMLELDQLDEYVNKIRSRPLINLIGGDKVPEDLYERMAEILDLKIHQGYASTEGGLAFLTPYGDEGKVGTLGRVVLGADLLLQDLATNEIKRFGEGELLSNTPGMMKGYWNLPELEKEAFVEVNEKRYYKTGDVIRIMEDGYGYFIDRIKDIIKYKGYQISSGEIEDVLCKHPAVKEAAVIGVPNPKVGEYIKAYIVLKSDVRGVTATDILRYCRKNLAPYKVPHWVEFRSYLPRGRVGKVLKRKLREEELALRL